MRHGRQTVTAQRRASVGHRSTGCCAAHCGIAAACRAHGRHKLDDTFFTPRVIVGVSIYSNEMAHAARPRLLADIMLRLFHLSVRAHSAQRAAHAVQP
jgi:hypothetical protein